MQRFLYFSRLNDEATPAPSATVSVYQVGTAILANLYDSDDTLGPKSNPFTAGGDGLAECYAANGRYDIQFSGGGITTPWSLGDVLLFDPADDASNARIYNVQDYGATGDGSTDDTASCQAAMDACAAAGGGVVYWPAGTYRLSAALTYTVGLTTFRGDGDQVSILLWDDNATKGLTVIGSAALVSQAFASDCAVGDRAITLGSAAGLANGGWAYLEDSAAHTGSLLTKIKSIAGAVVTLEDAMPCVLTTAQTATLYSYTALLEGIAVRDLGFRCASLGSTASKLTLLQLTRCNAPILEYCDFNGSVGPLVTISTCRNGRLFHNTGRNALTVAGTGIEVQVSTGMDIHANTFTLCQFGITVNGSPWSRVIGNRIEGRATSVALGRGIRAADRSNFSCISGNTVSDPNLYGIYLQDTSYTAVTGNTVAFAGDAVTTGQHGIQAGGFDPASSQYNAISGNTVTGCSGYGIALNDATNGSFGANVIAGNTLIDNVQGAVFANTGSNAITGNTCRGAGATVIGAIIRITFTATNNVVTGNVVTASAGTPVAIDSSGGSGGNKLFGNIVGTLVIRYNSTASPPDQVTPTQPSIFSTTQVGTDADLLQKTLWDITIPKGVLVTPNTGFRAQCTFSFAANANGKTLGVTLGTGTPITSTQTHSNQTVQVEIWGYVISNTDVRFSVEMRDNAGGIFRSSFSSCGDNFGTTDIHMLITGQNAVANANDIVFQLGQLQWIGV